MNFIELLHVSSQSTLLLVFYKNKINLNSLHAFHPYFNSHTILLSNSPGTQHKQLVK